MSDDDRERLEADRRYNDALAALDRALVGTAGLPGSGPAFDTLAPVRPASVRRPSVRIVYRCGDRPPELITMNCAFRTRRETLRARRMPQRWS